MGFSGLVVLIVIVGFLLLIGWFAVYFMLHEERKFSLSELLRAIWELLKGLISGTMSLYYLLK